MHMISKKDLNSAELDILTTSKSPMTVKTAVNSWTFLTMKVLENTPAVLSLGKLWDENGYSYEWINGQKPHLIKKNGIRIQCNTKNFVPVVVPGLSASSSSSSSPTVSEIQTREREDRIDTDISPVQVSTSVDDRSGQPDETQANKIPKTNKKETPIERENPSDSEIPEWLQEFRENVVDDEIPVHGYSHANSSHEPSLEPTPTRSEDLGKYSVYTHFSKDRNCEIPRNDDVFIDVELYNSVHFEKCPRCSGTLCRGRSHGAFARNL